MENNDSDNDSVRLPDKSFKQKLIEDNSDEDELDLEMKLAMEVSRTEYYDTLNTNQDTIFFRGSPEGLSQMKSSFSMDLAKDSKKINTTSSISIEEQDKIFEEEVKLALEISDQVYLKDLKEESYALENDKSLSESDKKLLEEQKIIEIEKRSKSLENFKKKIQGLSLSVSDIRIKKYIEKILLTYFELAIDFVYVDNDIYDDLYKIVDSYYLIPIQKNYKKTAITEEEDILIRSIFRKLV
jgi:hypothetical protein